MKSIIDLIYAASRNVQHIYGDRLEPYGLTPRHAAIMHALAAQSSPIRQIDLCEMVSADRSTLGQALEHLERLGIILRAVDNEDARAKRVSLTGSGRKIERKIVAHEDRVITDILAAAETSRSELAEPLARIAAVRSEDMRKAPAKKPGREAARAVS